MKRKFLFVILIIISIANTRLILTMEQDLDTEEFDLPRAFIAFNTTYIVSLNPPHNDQQTCQFLNNFSKRHPKIYQLPAMPFLRKTKKVLDNAVRCYNFDAFKILCQRFIQEIDACEAHMANYPLLKQGKQELKTSYEKKLKYFTQIEAQSDTFVFNNALIKTIKTDPYNLTQIQQLLLNGASINSRDVFTGDLAITLAIKSFNMITFSLLLQYQPDLNLPNDNIDTAKPDQTQLVLIAHQIRSLREKEMTLENKMKLTTLTIMFFMMLHRKADITLCDQHGLTVKDLVPDFVA